MKNIWMIYDRKDKQVSMFNYSTKKEANKRKAYLNHSKYEHPDGNPRFVVGRLVLEESK